MAVLVILRGVPASGKSTYADYMKTQGYVVVNRDSIRFSLFGAYWGPGVDEDLVTTVENHSIRQALKAGRDVVVDATNLNDKFVSVKLGYAAELGAEVEFVDFPISLKNALLRDALRERTVGSAVIERFYEGYKIDRASGKMPPRPAPFPAFERYIPNASLPSAYIVDTDGTVADHTGVRNPYDTSKYSLDTPRQHVVDVVQSLWEQGHMIVGVSGRSSEFREVTTDWWMRYDIPFDAFFMRAEGDTRNDAIVKYELFQSYVKDRFYVKGAFDDRPRVYRMWKSLGIPVFNVNDEEEEF